MGEIMDSPMDFYGGRLTRRERKNTLVEELMHDERLRVYTERKTKQIAAMRAHVRHVHSHRKKGHKK